MIKQVVVITSLLIGFGALSQNDYPGDYSGELKVMGTALPLVFHIQEGKKNYKVTMDSPNQGGFDIPMEVNYLENDSLNLEIASAGISYRGRFITQDSISGTFNQNGQKIPLNLKKGNTKGPKRPQNPERPYPYQEREVVFTNKNSGIKLAGTLTLPDDAENVPAVVLVTGSGPQDRNENLMGHKPFLVIADYLTRNGIAVLRYDERGVGASEGKFQGSTTYDFADDTAAAIRFLSNQPHIDINRIGIIGHSEGGSVVEILAARNSQLRFGIMLAGPAIPGEELLLQQERIIAEKSGVSEKEITSGLTLNQGAFAIVKTTPLAQLNQKLDAYFRENGIENEKQIKGMQTQMANAWMKQFLKLNPSEFLQQSQIPILALYGTKDVQVPSETNAKALENFPNVMVKTFTGLNHLFQKAETGLPNEYAQIEQTISPAVLKAMTDFILERK